MIEFLSGAFAVLGKRADKIVEILDQKQDVPESVLEHSRRVSGRITGLRDSVTNKLEILDQLRKGISAQTIQLSQADKLLRRILTSYRSSRRDIDAIEENFVGHLVRYNAADFFFTQLASLLWKETNLPDTPPIAVTNTSGYFCTWAAVGIVFSPPSCDHNLLVFPDLYHEFGHVLQQGVKLRLFDKRFTAELGTYIVGLENQVKRTSRPLDKNMIVEIAYRWENSWAEEIACDTLATIMMGPAYGWCNFHLCLQSSDVYHRGAEHPADAARTKHILRILRRRGFQADAAKLESVWDQYMKLSQQTKANYYNDFHPDSLFIAIMEDVEEAIQINKIGPSTSTPTIDLLNESWEQFLNDTDNYNEWAETAVDNLQVKLRSS